jgi:PAS domain S-box-containing protein
MSKNRSPGSNRTITKTLLSRIIIVSLLSMGVFIGSFVYWGHLDFQSRTETMRRDHVKTQMALVRSEVEKAVDYILYEKARTEQRLKEGLRGRVYEAHAIATNIYREYSASRADDDIRKMIKDALRSVRFNSGRGYYFATNLDGKEELFADRPGEEGKDYLNVRDSRGGYPIREMIEVARGAGEGFVEYAWTKPGEEGNDFPKVAFVKLFEPLNYFIGTGEYIDDTTADIQAEVLRRVGTIQYAGNGYIFVVSYDGIVLSGHPKQKNVGKNLWDMEDPDGVKVIQEERRAVENPEGGFIHYRWPKPGNAEPAPKISFLKGIPDWEWMVGTGVYVDEMEPAIADMAWLLRKQIVRRVLLVGAAFFGLVLIMFSLAMQSARFVREGFDAFSSFFEKAAAESVRVDEDKLYFAEFRRLAGPANRMVDERRRFEEKLSSELEKRVRVQVDLEKSEGKLRNLFSSIRDVIVVADNDRLVIDANQPALRDKFGYEVEDIAGKKTSVLYGTVSAFEEAGRKVFEGNLERAGKLLELNFKKKNGDVFPAELSALKLIGDDGKPIGNIGVIRDITQRKKVEESLRESEEKYQKLFNNEIDAISIFDVETKKLLDVNKAWLKLYGYSREETLQLAVYDISAEPEQSKEAIDRAAASGDTLIPVRHHRRKDGTEFWVELSAGPFTWKGRRVMYAVVRDITSRKQAEEFLRRAKDSLEQQNEELRKIGRMKDALLRDVSHELKTPVAKHAMQLEILRPLLDSNRVTEGERRSFSVMEKSIRRQESVISNLLGLARLESGGRQYRKESFRLDKLTEKVLEDYAESIEARGIAVSVNMPEISMSSDIEMLWHVFSNLISNAIKFQRREGLPEISISSQARDKHVIVKIEDNGIGMSREVQERIFARFFQASASIEGSGVGLTICKHIVEDLEGSIRMTSQGPGHGCVVEVTLPLA